ncbi:hypothetical protein DTO212C5_2383 [Paecilomyces variotii]|nr:hypothetical protein DTO212C5_2383 [Paecilomyces variotii]
MAPRLALGHCFFSHDDVELASLIPNIRDPELDAMENPYPLQRSDYTVKRVHDYSALLRTQRTRKGEAVLSKVVKFTSKKTRLSNMHLEARTGYIYTLRKPSVWFRRLCEDKIIRHWLQEQIEDGNVVHFVVGLHTLFDAATSSNANLAMQHSGELTMPVSDAGGWSNLSHAGDFSLSGGQWYNKDSQNACKAPGEQIFAIRVKKVKFRFWDTHDVENVRLGKNSYWKMASDNRSATEDDSEIVEAFLDKAEKAESDSEDDEKSDKFSGRLSDDDSSDDELYFIDSDEE